MIEGLYMELKSAELKEHIQERADHHRKRAAWYAQQAEQLKAGHEPTDPDSHGRSFDPLDGLIGKANEHRQRVVYFQFMADHIVPNEIYRLSEQDVARIEIYSRYL